MVFRNKIGKGFSNDDLFQAVQKLSKSTIQILKLYFMIGLPGEAEKDLQSIIQLSKELSSCFRQYKKNKLVRISVNGFIPKPFTEFQFAAMQSEKELNQKRQMIRNGLKRESGIQFKNKSTREEVLQAVLTLGSEKTGLSMCNVVLDKLTWKTALKKASDPVLREIHRERGPDIVFPWDFIHYESDKSDLWKRYQKFYQ